MESFLHGRVGFRTRARTVWRSQWLVLAVSVVFVPTPLLAVINTYRWEGQSLAFVFLPFAAVVSIGVCLLVFFFHIRKRRCDWGAALGMFAGVTFVGSAALYATQVVPKSPHIPLVGNVVVVRSSRDCWGPDIIRSCRNPVGSETKASDNCHLWGIRVVRLGWIYYWSWDGPGLGHHHCNPKPAHTISAEILWGVL
jgi:hypothetical protein